MFEAGGEADKVFSPADFRAVPTTDISHCRLFLRDASAAVLSLISETAFQQQGSLLEGLLAKDRQTFPTALHELPARPLLTQDL